jgi:hypothetical protein
VCVCRCIIRWIRFQLISHWILDTHGIDISRGKGSINLDVHEIFFGSCDGLMLTIEKFILNHPKCARLFSDARDDRVYWSPASSYFLVKNKTRAAEYWSPALLDSFLIWWRRPLSAFSLSLYSSTLPVWPLEPCEKKYQVKDECNTSTHFDWQFSPLCHSIRRVDFFMIFQIGRAVQTGHGMQMMKHFQDKEI